MRMAQVLLAGLVLAGCASYDPVYDPVIPFETQGVTGFRVHNDGMPEAASAYDTPRDYSNVYMPYNPAVGAGAAAVGGAIAILLIASVDAQMDDIRGRKVDGFPKEKGFDAKKVFYDALSAELKTAGYGVEVTEAKSGAPEAPALMLDIDLPYYGFTLVGPEWAPAAVATVEVKSADGKQTLLKDSLVVGSPMTGFAGVVGVYGPGSSAIVMPYDPAHLIANEDTITQGDPAATLASMRFALEAVAGGVADLVRQAAPTPAVEPAPAAPVVAQ